MQLLYHFKRFKSIIEYHTNSLTYITAYVKAIFDIICTLKIEEVNRNFRGQKIAV